MRLSFAIYWLYIATELISSVIILCFSLYHLYWNTRKIVTLANSHILSTWLIIDSSNFEQYFKDLVTRDMNKGGSRFITFTVLKTQLSLLKNLFHVLCPFSIILALATPLLWIYIFTNLLWYKINNICFFLSRCFLLLVRFLREFL